MLFKPFHRTAKAERGKFSARSELITELLSKGQITINAAAEALGSDQSNALWADARWLPKAKSEVKELTCDSCQKKSKKDMFVDIESAYNEQHPAEQTLCSSCHSDLSVTTETLTVPSSIKPLIEYKLIYDIVNPGETDTVEFKRGIVGNESMPKIIQEICGFMNHNGGYLFVGIDDDIEQSIAKIDEEYWMSDFIKNGKLDKQEILNRVSNQIKDGLKNGEMLITRLNIKWVVYKEGEVLCITCPGIMSELVKVQEKNGEAVYLRMSDSNRKMDNDEIIERLIRARHGQPDIIMPTIVDY